MRPTLNLLYRPLLLVCALALLTSPALAGGNGGGSSGSSSSAQKATGVIGGVVGGVVETVAQDDSGTLLGLKEGGEGVVYGDWRIWRAKGDDLLLLHKDEQVAVEIWTKSNGWFRYRADGKDRIIWSVGTEDQQDLEADIKGFSKQRPTQKLKHSDGKIGSYLFEVSGDVLRLKCDADSETIEFNPHSASFLFIDSNGARHTLPSNAPVKAAAATPVVAPSGDAIGGLAVGEGAHFGQWIVWRMEGDYVVLVHAATKMGVEVWTDSNGWFRYFAEGHGRVIWSLGNESDQDMHRVDADLLIRPASGTLKAGAGKMGRYHFVVKDDVLTLRCDADDETITLRADAANFEFLGSDKSRTILPRSAAAPTQDVVKKTEMPAGKGQVTGLAALEEGDDAVYGGWSIWRTKGDYLLFIRDDVVLEVWIESNGWFRYRAADTSHVVWSSGDQADQGLSLVTGWKTLTERKASGELTHSDGTIGTYTFSVNADRLTLKCAASGEVITLKPDARTFTFKGNRGTVSDLPH